MKIIEHNNIRSFITFGDIHGEFHTFFNTLKKGLHFNKETYKEEVHPLVKQEMEDKENQNDGLWRPRSISFGESYHKKYDFTRKLIFVCGDCGFGFNKHQYYVDTFKMINEILKNNDSYLYFIRGNHDDPSYFKEDKLNFSNIKCIDDYTVIKIKNENILCVGGGISVDRIWRKQQEHVINKYKSENSKKKLYWENEAPIYDENELLELIKQDININHIITHSAPSFADPKYKDTSLEWYKLDSSLKDDVKYEREVFDNIYNFLKEHKMTIKTWSYGHFHQDYSNLYKDETLMTCLSEMMHVTPLNLYNDLIRLTNYKKVKKNSESIINNLSQENYIRFNAEQIEQFEEMTRLVRDELDRRVRIRNTNIEENVEIDNNIEYGLTPIDIEPF